ncbi:MAG: sigma 54-interacting transcriptional regulator [Holophaga sp.]
MDVSAGWDKFAETMFEASKSRYATVGLDGLVRYANPLARESMGLLPGRLLVDLVPEIQDRLSQVLGGGENPEGALLRCGEATYLVNLSPVQADGKLLGALCNFIDMNLTEAEMRQLRTYEELIRLQDAIIDSLPDGLWISDGQGTVVRINPASERLNGVTAQQVLGRNMRDLVKEKVFERSTVLEVLRSKAPYSVARNRKGRFLALSGTPVFNEAGEIIRVVVAERDITEIETLHKDLEEQESMNSRFRERLAELQLEEVESHRVIAKSDCMQKAIREAIKASSGESTVLLLGESGVGKELFADLIYKYSGRAGKPLVKINCGAIPESLLEAELFGYEKGAFTGAQTKGKPGYFELADGGIMFLDEVAELTLSAQVKLLRFLEDGRVTRVGGTQSRKLDVRILAATHRDLTAMVESGSFRLDLFYRLNIIPIHIPPLRERKECVLPLLYHYLDQFETRSGVRHRFTRAATDVLLAYQWPGNVRELANLCQRLAVMSDVEMISLGDIPPEIVGKSALVQARSEDLSLREVLENTERTLLLEARQRHGTQALMAEALGMDRSTIARKLMKYGIK